MSLDELTFFGSDRDDLRVGHSGGHDEERGDELD